MTTSKTLFAAAMVAAIGLSVQAKADCEPAAELKPCNMCHALTGTAAKSTGPNIVHVYGSKAMQSDGFAYSAAVKKAAEKGLVWTPENLDAYLADQHGFLAKFNGEELPNKMILVTYKDPAKRAPVIAALKALAECK